MKVVLAVLVLAVVIGCGSTGTAEKPTKKPQEMPSSMGVTAGQSGTGVTSGGSTGY